jgi:SAM-dependent methyltransferase
MNRDEILSLYDDNYAETYEDNFLFSPLSRSDAEHEVELLRGFLDGGRRPWLDVACGTGYFLRQFPGVERAGLDLSPAMLRRARQGNPDILLVERDFREPMPEWCDAWGLVSCMWYAYSLVDNVADVLRLIGNLAAWTAPGGVCFVPLADPRLITGLDLPYQAFSPNPGKVMITGILWSYVEDDGRKVHSHLIAPNLEFMIEQFQVYFDEVSIVRYPPAFPGWQGRPALVATSKRA